MILSMCVVRRNVKILLNIAIWSVCAFVLAACQTTQTKRGSVQGAVKFQKAPSGIAGNIELAAIPNWSKTKSPNGKVYHDARGTYRCLEEKCKNDGGFVLYLTDLRRTKGGLEKIKAESPKSVTTVFARLFAFHSNRSKKKSRSQKYSVPISYTLDGKAEFRSYRGFPSWGVAAFSRLKNNESGLFVYSIFLFDETTLHVFFGLAKDKKRARRYARTLASAWRPLKGS